ncbi:MAG: ATP-binding protein [Desulfurococcaceae archaeon]
MAEDAGRGLALRRIGNVVGETTHLRVTFIAERPPRVGQYVLVEYEGDGGGITYALGMVELSKTGNPMLDSKTLRPEYFDVASRYGYHRMDYSFGVARLLSWLEPLLKQGTARSPKEPPRPGAGVFEPSPEVLGKIFARPRRGVRLGVLVNHPEVPVHVDVNSIISRHLAILAVTGAGKSNAVGVLVSRIVEELGGTVLIFDMHNEYGDVAGERTRAVEARINPSQLTLSELYRLLGLDEKASKQRMYLRKAYRELSASGARQREPHRFLENLLGKVRSFENSDRARKDRGSIEDLANKLEELMEEYGDTVLSPEAPLKLTDAVRPGMANVFMLGSLGEEVADVIVYHYLDWLLRERKRHVLEGNGYPVPALAVIEEAHVLVPRLRSTLSKSIVGRVAREGRKFGVGLCLVSQRPKNVDEDALSQTNNKIILRLVEPSDQRYVQAASETLSDELLDLLPSLDVGEAVLLGMMTPLPALVKIDKAAGKARGGDLDVAGEWTKFVQRKEEMAKEAEKYLW